MRDLVIAGGRLVDPSESLDGLWDLLLRDGKVAAIEVPGGLAGVRDAETLDARGCVVSPGLIDVHVHLREPGQTWKETIATGTRAAAAGGFTTVVAMPNTVPVCDSVERMAWMLAPERGAAIRLLAMPAATFGSHGIELTDYILLAQAGAAGFTDDGKPVLAEHVMRAALVLAGRLGLPISQHAEDTRISPSSGVNAGAMAFRLGLRGMTVEAESSIVERDLRLLREIEKSDRIRPHLHVQHVSTAKALAAIRLAKRQGLQVTCEVAPHHFALTEEAIGDGASRLPGQRAYDTNAKMNPPLRSEHDRQACLEGLADGTVDAIATDHAPHASWEKEQEFERAPNGITGLETALGLALAVTGLSDSEIVRVMSTNPAQVMGRSDLGTLRVGAEGDVCVFESGTMWRYDSKTSLSKSRNTPFDGIEMRGRIRATVFAGAVVYGGVGSP